MLIALLIPRLPLQAALAARPGPPPPEPMAVGPDPLGAPRVDAPSAAAAAMGVRAGMPLSEALALCPGLALVPPDPAGARRLGERLLAGVEALGLPVEPLGADRALLDAAPGLRLHGGPARLVARLQGLLPDAGLRIGAAPARFAALAAARGARRRPRILAAGDLPPALAPLPVRLLHEDGGIDPDVCRALELVGIDRLGGLAALPRLSVRDRFGAEGLRAWRMSRGEDGGAIAPRRPETAVRAVLAPPHPVATDQALEQALAVLLADVLADPARGLREPRLVRLEADLITGESWLCEAPLREPTAEPRRLLLALLPKARRLPAPAERLALVLGRLAPGGRQLALLPTGGEERADRIGDAERQVRAAVGPGALLRIVGAETGSRLPERRYGLRPR